MKEKLKKTLSHFFFLLPLFWVFGFAAAMTERYEPVKSNLFLYYSMHAILIGLTIYVSSKGPREIKGWYAFLCIVGAIGISVLSMWVHYTL